MSIYTKKMKTPFPYNGETYEELTFDFDKLRGKDGIDIENELLTQTEVVLYPILSPEYMTRFISKACEQPIGFDGFQQMSYVDYKPILERATKCLQNYGTTETDGWIVEYTFKEPVTYGDKTYESMTFDFGTVTVADTIEADRAMRNASSVFVLVKDYNAEYAINIAARCCNERVDAAFFRALPYPDYEAIRRAVRDFLTEAE